MTLHAALERGGTDAKVVESILINETNNADLFAVIEAYEDLYGNLDNCNYNNNKYALYDHIAFDFSFGKEDELLGMLKNAIDKHDQQKQTEIPKEQAEQTIALARALAIFEATEARNGTDESVVNEILTSLSDEELRLMAQQCPNVGEGRSLVELIKGDYSGEIEKALLTKLEKAGITA